MESVIRKEGYQVPQVDLYTLENMELNKTTSAELFNNKRVVVFSMVGANLYLDGAFQLQDIIQSYQNIIDEGVDKVYVILVNDVWTLNRWDNDNSFSQTGDHIKIISDGNAFFTSTMGYLVSKNNLGYGKRSWRYAMVVQNGIIEKVFAEPGMCDNCEEEPYEETNPSKILEYLRS